jgi:hypothetical protein
LGAAVLLLVLMVQIQYLPPLLALVVAVVEQIRTMVLPAVLVVVVVSQPALVVLARLIKVMQVALLHHLPAHLVLAAAAVRVLLVETKQVAALAVTAAQEFSRQLLDHLLNAQEVAVDRLKEERKQLQPAEAVLVRLH